MAMSRLHFLWAVMMVLFSLSKYDLSVAGQEAPSLNQCSGLLPDSCGCVQAEGPRVTATLQNGYKVLCDTETEGGGWLVFQRRFDGSVRFNRTWAEYKYGFGDINGEFWFGNERIHHLTTQAPYELRIDLKYDGKPYYAKYSHFRIYGEPENYTLDVSGHSGNAEDALALFHNGMPFSTLDRDISSCSATYHGGWWYNVCLISDLNGEWGSKEIGQGVIWFPITNFDDSASFTEMKIRLLK